MKKYRNDLAAPPAIILTTHTPTNIHLYKPK